MLKNFYKNSSLIVFIIITIIGLGLYLFYKIPISLYPETSKPEIRASLNFQGIDAKSFYDEYGRDLEAKLRAIKTVEKVTGEYNTGYANWSIEFNWGVEVDDASSKVTNVTSSFENRLPSDWPHIYTFSHSKNNFKNIVFSVQSNELSEGELYEKLNSNLKADINSIDGFDKSLIIRPQEPEIKITLDLIKIMKWNIFPNHIKSLITNKLSDIFLGEVEFSSGENVPLFVPDKIENIVDLKNLKILRVGTRDIRLKDVAKIEKSIKDPHEIQKGNGKRGILIYAQVKQDANIVKSCDEFAKVVNLKTRELVNDAEIIELVNPSNYIKEAISAIIQAVILGVIISTILLLLVFGSFSYTAVVAISIPLSLIGGFIIMNIFNMEINLISLGAMALASGMVVDGAIVVLDNIVRLNEERNPITIKEKLDTLYDAVNEVKAPIIASILTTIIVFSPLTFTSPLAYAILGDLAKVMICVLIVSIFICLYIIPPLIFMLKSKFESTSRFGRIVPNLIENLKNLYLKSLNNLLISKEKAILFLTTTGILLILAIFVYSFSLERTILEKAKTDKVWFFLNFQGDQKSIKINDETTKKYESIIEKEFSDDITLYYTRVTKHSSQILINLKDKNNIDNFKKRLETRFKNTSKIHFTVYPWLPSQIYLPEENLVEFEVLGDDRKKNRDLLEKLRTKINNIDEVYVYFKPESNLNNKYEIIWNQEALETIKNDDKYFSEENIYSLIEYFTRDKEIKTVNFKEKNLPINMGIRERKLDNIYEIENLSINIKDKFIPLRNLMKIKAKKTWDMIHSENAEESISVSIKLRDSYKDKKDEVREKVISTISEFDQSQIKMKDVDKEINENIESLLYALLIALTLIWLLINFQFGSHKISAIILLAIPFGFIGSSAAMYFSSSAISINAMLGLILLCGTAVNNSIIFVDFFAKIHTGNSIKKEALLKTASLRFRPILLTTLTTILGMLPIAIGYGTGAEVLQSLGITVCGGLTISTILTLYGVPISLNLLKTS